MNVEHRKIIKENQCHLGRSIDHNKIIQHLYDYKMFNKCMWEDIHSVSDVLELLPTRGPEAFRDFIEILRKAGYDTEADLLEKPTLLLESYDSKLYYKMSSKPLGYCLIINNIQFRNLDYRVGSEIDTKCLQDFFERAGFQVEKPRINLTKQQMNDCLLTFSKKDFSKVHSMILIIMTHGGLIGNKEVLYGSDEDFIYKREVYDYFSNKNCEELQSKPKVFFFIACRGKGKDYGTERVFPKESLDSVGNILLPIYSDMLIINSTLPDNVTVRDHDKGTYFCQAIISVLNDYYKIHDLETIIKLVNQRLEGKVSEIYRIVQAVHTENFVFKKKLMLCNRN